VSTSIALTRSMACWVGSMMPLSAPASIANDQEGIVDQLPVGRPKLTLLIPPVMWISGPYFRAAWL